MCRKESFKIKSRIDNLEIAGLFYMPEIEKCRGVVQIVHGMCEHKERYDEFMSFLAEKGFAAIIHDKRGHGESVRVPADLGYMYGGGAEAYIEDIFQVNEWARAKVPNTPVIMFGHSMGSLGARAFTKEYDDMIDALIISGSPSKNPALGAGTMVAKLQKTILGGKHPAKLLEKISFGGYEARFKEEKKAFAWLCTVPEVVDAYVADPLCGFTFTADAYLVLFELMKHTYDEHGWKCSKPELPVWFIAGEDDPCIENKEKFDEAVTYMKKAGYRDVEGKLYKGMRHEICNEKDKQKVFEDVVLYLESKGF